MNIHNTEKLPFLLRDKKHECSLAYLSLLSATAIIQNCFVN